MFIVFEIEHIPASKHREALNTLLPLGTIVFRKEEDAWKYVERFINVKVELYKKSYTMLSKWGHLFQYSTLESYLQSALDISFTERSVEITEKNINFRTTYLIAEYKIQ